MCILSLEATSQTFGLGGVIKPGGITTLFVGQHRLFWVCLLYRHYTVIISALQLKTNSLKFSDQPDRAQNVDQS